MKAGLWEGKLIDSTGPTGLFDVQVRVKEGRVVGEFRVSFLPPPDDACGGQGPRLAAEGPVRGTVGRDGSARLRTKMEVAGQGIAVILQLRPGDAAPHAKAAMYGTYDVVEGADVLTLQGGACVMWQYAGARQRRAS